MEQNIGNLTLGQVTDLKEMFREIAGKRQYLKAIQLEELLHRIGLFCTPDDLRKKENFNFSDCVSTVENALYFANTRMREIKGILGKLDIADEDGTIDSLVLRNILRSSNFPLSQKEFELLLQDVMVTNGKVKWDDFLNSLTINIELVPEWKFSGFNLQ